ncbi:hypothetical protein AK830_g8040 [Neonectria ditissima]|uniref:Dehydrogenase FUB6 n=1 Tax=Neonectria ditissima TaxID=78410 RepID=A0A0P7AYC9_9HYPO|nr:hypothetical protein AK830_g8040 [Neonectria ditissima]
MPLVDTTISTDITSTNNHKLLKPKYTSLAMASPTLQIIIKSRPHDAILPAEVFTSRTVPPPSPADLAPDEILIETLYLSLDPVMRDWLNASNGIRETTPGEVMSGPLLARVLASRSAALPVGTLVHGFAPWASVSAIPAAGLEDASAFLPAGLPVTDLLGVLGFTGLTAYFAMLRVGRPLPGETVVVSTAAGATGSVAAQLAKIRGARVVGIAGGPQKGRWLRELGVDEVLDYKDPGYEDAFAKAVAGGIDLYFDNVGGRTLELAIENIKESGRIIIVGATGDYNTSNPHRIKSLFPLAPKSATVHGFNIFKHLKDAAEARAELSQWLQDGTLKRTQTVIKGGLEAAPQGLADMFKGKNTGKMLVEVKAD